MNHVISRDELRNRLSSVNRPVLVEALPEKFYMAKHLPGARHLPHDQVDALAAAYFPKNQRKS